MSVERILDDYRDGRLERRSAIRQLGLCFAALLSTGGSIRAAEPGFRAAGLNHLALRVTDVAHSRDFYIKHFGLEVLRDNAPTNCFLGCGENFVALFRAKTAGMDHFCLTVEDYDPARALRELKSMGLESHRVEDRVYFKDPDGLEGQVSARVIPF